MQRSIFALQVLVGALAFGCTNVVVEGDDMLGDRRMLDQSNERRKLVGQKLVLDVSTLSITAAEVGTGQVTRLFPGWRVSAKEESTPESFTFMIDSFQLNKSPNADVSFTFLYARIQFGSGDAQHGTDQQTTLTVPVNSQILVDVPTGTNLSLAGNYFQVDFVYRSFGALPAFLLGTTPGPNFGVNASLAYAPKTNTLRPTFTVPVLASPVTIDPLVLGAGGSGNIPRPMYAQEVEFTWAQYSTVGPLTVQFIANNGGVLATYSIAANTLPPPRLTWPTESMSLTATNAAGVQMNNVMARNYLAL